MAVTANISISFGDDDSEGQGVLTAEVDNRTVEEGGLNGGETSFNAGDTAWFLVFKSDNVTYDPPIASAGTVNAGGTETVIKNEELTFSDTDTASLSVPADSITSTTWMGNSLGGLVLQSDKQTVKTSSKGVAIAKVKYTASGKAYGLISPISVQGFTDFSINVFIKGTVNE